MPISPIVFAGQDASGNTSLWVTTRSASGISELVATAANAGGLFNSSYLVRRNSGISRAVGMAECLRGCREAG